MINLKYPFLTYNENYYQIFGCVHSYRPRFSFIFFPQNVEWKFAIKETEKK